MNKNLLEIYYTELSHERMFLRTVTRYEPNVIVGEKWSYRVNDVHIIHGDVLSTITEDVPKPT